MLSSMKKNHFSEIDLPKKKSSRQRVGEMVFQKTGTGYAKALRQLRTLASVRRSKRPVWLKLEPKRKVCQEITEEVSTRSSKDL